MSRHTRAKDLDWHIREEGQSGATWDGAKVAVLMDIRDELKALRRIFECPNFLDVPRLLREIQRNTTKKRKKVRR